jgi:hypothetical protein
VRPRREEGYTQRYQGFPGYGRILAKSLPMNKTAKIYHLNSAVSAVGKAQEMKSGHIDSRKLYQVVNKAAILAQAEIEHLSTCEECLEMIRTLIQKQLQ